MKDRHHEGYVVALRDHFVGLAGDDSGWHVTAGFSPEQGHSVEFHHELGLGAGFHDSTLTVQDLDSVAAKWDHVVASQQAFSVARAAPTIEHPESVREFHHLINSMGWGPRESFNLCGTLVALGFLTPDEGDWLTWFCSVGSPQRVVRSLDASRRSDDAEAAVWFQSD